MIWLTRMNGKKFVLNCDLIRSMESTPDTVITLTQGEKLMVREDAEAIVRLTLEFKRKISQADVSFSISAKSEG